MQNFLKKNEFSIKTTVTALWEDGVKFFSFFLMMMVMLIPGIKLLIMTMVWFTRANIKHLHTLKFIISAVTKWSMLDVFTLGFFIFIFEASEIVEVEYRFGLTIQLISFIINTALDITYHLSIAKTI